jgi:subtilisin family serine protease
MRIAGRLDLEINHFDYATSVPDVRVDDATEGPSVLASAPGDAGGTRCPHFAHVRKVDLRDKLTDQGPSFRFAAPGVNITSSVPARRQADGTIEPNLTRADLSDRDSGTSMATPIVSGVLALMLQQRMEQGQPIDSSAIRAELLTHGFKPLARPAYEIGVGRRAL